MTRPPATRGVALIPYDREAAARLSGALRERAVVLPCLTVASVQTELDAGRADLVIVSVQQGSAGGAAGLIRRLREGFPSVPIVAYCDVHGIDRQILMEVVQAGATDLVLKGIDDSRVVLLQVLDHAQRQKHAERVEELIGRAIPDWLRPLVSFGLRHPDAADDLRTTAANLGMARRTLAVRLANKGAPSPRRLFTWTRLLLAASMLADRGRTLDAVALELGLASGNGLRLLLRRYAGQTFSSMRHGDGPIAAIVAAFLAELAGTPAQPPAAGGAGGSGDGTTDPEAANDSLFPPSSSEAEDAGDADDPGQQAGEGARRRRERYAALTSDRDALSPASPGG